MAVYLARSARHAPIVVITLVVVFVLLTVYGRKSAKEVRSELQASLEATARKMVDRTCRGDVACRQQLEAVVTPCADGAVTTHGTGKARRQVLDQAAFARCAEHRTGRKVQLLLGEF